MKVRSNFSEISIFLLKGFEQLFPFFDNDDDKVMGPIQFTTMTLVRQALTMANISSNVYPLKFTFPSAYRT